MSDESQGEKSGWSKDKQKLFGVLLAILATFIGAAFTDLRGETKELRKEVKDLSTSITSLDKSVAVLSERQLEVATVRDDLRSHRNLEGHTQTVARVERLAADLEALREVVREHTAKPGHDVGMARVEANSAAIRQTESSRFTQRDGAALDARVERLEADKQKLIGRVAALERFDRVEGRKQKN